MARKPTLSPSRISTYLACPVKYRWTYVDSRGHWYSRAKSYYSFGLTLHRVLEAFHTSGDRGVPTAHEAIAAMEENWLDAGYSSPDEMADAIGEGKQILERYVEQQRVPTAAKTLCVEKTFKLDFDDFRLLGRVDRVDEHPDGSLEIVDYKSGRQTVTDEDVASDLAMGCYQLLVRHKHPDRRVFATIHALRTGDKASAELDDAALAELRGDLQFIGTEILNRDYPNVAPIPKRLCSGCDFLPLCRKHPDFDACLVEDA